MHRALRSLGINLIFVVRNEVIGAIDVVLQI